MNSRTESAGDAREWCKKLDPNLRVPLIEANLTPAGLEMRISVDVFENPASWGMFMADLARHVADAYHEAHGLSKRETFDHILEMFQAEIAHPTSEAQGHLHRLH